MARLAQKSFDAKSYTFFQELTESDRYPGIKCLYRCHLVPAPQETKSSDGSRRKVLCDQGGVGCAAQQQEGWDDL